MWDHLIYARDYDMLIKSWMIIDQGWKILILIVIVMMYVPVELEAIVAMRNKKTHQLMTLCLSSSTIHIYINSIAQVELDLHASSKHREFYMFQDSWVRQLPFFKFHRQRD